MNVIDQLASSIGRRDEVPNQELAERIAKKSDKAAVEELVEYLLHGTKDIQNDCIKVLYEIGERKPALVAPYIKQFVALLESKNNRLQWGAMTALNTITLEDPAAIFSSLKKIMAATDLGSVITNDQAVSMLIKLCSIKKYADDAFTLLIGKLQKSPTNQLPMYAEQAVPIVDDKKKATFLKTLTSRLADIEKESKRKRVEKVIRKLGG